MKNTLVESVFNDFIMALCVVLLITGCAAIEPSGKISGATTTIPEIIPQIEKGVTTKQELISKLGEPSTTMTDSEGNEILMFSERAPIGEGGVWGFLNPGRSKIRILNVTIRNGIVTDFSSMETWKSTPPGGHSR